MSFKNVKDGGEKHTVFETGGERVIVEGRGRYDLIPPYPMKRLAQHYENGAKKYADRNWEKGLPLHSFIDSTERHLNSFKDGDRAEDHLAAILWNIAGYMWTEREITEGRLPASLYTAPWSTSVVPEAPPEPIVPPYRGDALRGVAELDLSDEVVVSGGLKWPEAGVPCIAPRDDMYDPRCELCGGSLHYDSPPPMCHCSSGTWSGAV
jgi:hypothetical protein